MAMDGITIACIIDELKEKLLGGRIDKIYQPERDEVILSIRSLGANYKLLLTASAASPRLCLTSESRDNPMKPPLFCMVLRKHIGNGKIIAIEQPHFERIVIITVEAINEMGDYGTKRLIIEMMGKHSNLILTGDEVEILDSARHISFETSSVREVLPGKTYAFPPSKDKVNPLDPAHAGNALGAWITQSGGAIIQQVLYQRYSGISPVMASEICFRADLDPSTRGEELPEVQIQSLGTAFDMLMQDVILGRWQPTVYFDRNEKPFEFSAIPMTQFAGNQCKTFTSMSELLGFYYAAKDNTYRISQKSQDLKKLIQTHIERCVKKKDIQAKTLRDIESRDKFRIYGELLTANLHAVPQGAKSFTTQNYYEEDWPAITIPLDPQKTPSENAQRHFKRYNKEKRTFIAMQEQIRQSNEDLAYLEGVLTALQNAGDETELEEIRTELAEQGLAKRRSYKKGEKRQKSSRPYQYRSSDGFMICVGKNNKQNDELTLKWANGGDMWLHTKEIPGSHVIIRTEGREVPNATLQEAALLAAYYSKARQSSLVPVDYTLKKHVKKPSGAKPGMVIYETNQTAFVTLEEKVMSEILSRIE